MGFIAPGRSLKRRKKNSPLEKRKQFKPAPSLDSLPAEILWEIFVYSEFSSLPVVNKRLNAILSPNLPLKLSTLELYTHDLNMEVRKLDPSVPSEFAIDKCVLDYKFISLDLLRCVKNCPFLSKEDISDEVNRRGDTYKRSFKERSNLPIPETYTRVDTDFPQRFYRFPLKNRVLIQELVSRNLRFLNTNDAILGLFDSADYENQLSDYAWTLLFCVGDPEPMQPLIHLLRRGFYCVADDYISRYVDMEVYCRDESLWAFALAEQRNNLQLVHFLEEHGFHPCVKSLTYINRGGD